MYPKRDFKYLINQDNVSEETLISAIKREPLSEILWHWSQSKKPIQLLPTYQKGIEEAIAKDRYPLYQLEDIKSYPEFFLPALNGLKRLWLSLRFSYDLQSLLIDSIKGKNINISPEDKLNILNIIPYNICCNLLIDCQSCDVAIYTSRRAEYIYQLVLSLMLLNQEN